MRTSSIKPNVFCQLFKGLAFQFFFTPCMQCYSLSGVEFFEIKKAKKSHDTATLKPAQSINHSNYQNTSFIILSLQLVKKPIHFSNFYVKICMPVTLLISVPEPSNFSPAPAPEFFFRLRVKNIGSSSTQKISAPTGSVSKQQLVKICLNRFYL